jgi:hypothetical protein
MDEKCDKKFKEAAKKERIIHVKKRKEKGFKKGKRRRAKRKRNN